MFEKFVANGGVWLWLLLFLITCFDGVYTGRTKSTTETTEAVTTVTTTTDAASMDTGSGDDTTVDPTTQSGRTKRRRDDDDVVTTTPSGITQSKKLKINFPFNIQNTDITGRIKPDLVKSPKLGLMALSNEFKILDLSRTKRVLLHFDMWSDNQILAINQKLTKIVEFLTQNADSLFVSAIKINRQIREANKGLQMQILQTVQNIQTQVDMLRTYDLKVIRPMWLSTNNLCTIDYKYEFLDESTLALDILETLESFTDKEEDDKASLENSARRWLNLLDQLSSSVNTVSQHFLEFNSEIEAATQYILTASLSSKIQFSSCVTSGRLEHNKILDCYQSHSDIFCIISFITLSGFDVGNILMPITYPEFVVSYHNQYIQQTVNKAKIASIKQCEIDWRKQTLVCPSFFWGPSLDCLDADLSQDFAGILKHCPLMPSSNFSFQISETYQGLLFVLKPNTVKILVNDEIMPYQQGILNYGTNFILKYDDSETHYLASSEITDPELFHTWLSDRQLTQLSEKANRDPYGPFYFLKTKMYDIITFIYNCILVPLMIKGFIELSNSLFGKSNSHNAPRSRRQQAQQRLADLEMLEQL